MRGTTTFPLQLPSAALVANVPPHLAPPNSLIPGSFNIFHDIDGLTKPRSGYVPFQGLASVGQRLHGGIYYQDQNDNFQYVIASDTDWWALTGGAWTNITDPANKNIGVATDPARFQVFYQAGNAYAIGVDNFSIPKRWTSIDSVYETLTANTLTLSGITESGTLATATTTAPIPSQIQPGDLITISGSSVAGYNATWTITQIPTNTTFTFTATASLGSSTGGTVVDNTIMSAPPARDIAILANRVVMVNTTEGGVRFPRRIRWSANGDATRWPVLAYLDTLDANDQIVGIVQMGANLAVVYGETSYFFLQAIPGDDANAFADERIYAAQGSPGPVSPAAIVAAEGAHYYLGFDGRLYTFNGAAIAPLSQLADPVFTAALDNGNASKSHGAYLPSKRQIWFFMPTTTLTNVTVDPSVAEVLDLTTPQASVLPPQTFSEGITASFTGLDSTGITWQNSPYTWDNNPYTWENAPVGLETDMFTATASGEVDIFFHGNMDGANVYAIPWEIDLSYFHAESPLNQILLNQAEFYFEPINTTELVTAQFDTLNYPYDPGTPLVSFGMLISEGWVTMPTEPGPTNPSNIRNNFLSFSMFSQASKGGMAFAGGNLYCYEDTKGGYGKQ